MRLRRKVDAVETEVVEEEQAPVEAGTGPWDAAEVSSLEGYLDFGSLLVPVVNDAELRLNIDEASGRVMSLAWLTEEAGLEVSVFAAPRTPGVWDELRPDLVADATQRGGTVDHADGPYGAEVICSLPVQLPDGTGAIQATRIFATQGDRWLLRGALMGRPVTESEAAAPWYALFGALIVRRGAGAMPVGEALELRLPPEAQVEPGPEAGGEPNG
ncbi:MAG: DUF3710 domain-containing protein [Marmoricola sp.]